MRRILFTLLAAALVAVLAPSCSVGGVARTASNEVVSSPTATTTDRGSAMEHKDGEAAPAAEEEVDEGYYVEVETEGNRFVPAAVKMTLLQELEIVNKDTVMHNISVPASGINVDVPAGEEVYSGPIALPPGTYQFVCRIHGASGMRGTFTMAATREVILLRRGY